MAYDNAHIVDIPIANDAPDSYDWKQHGRVSEVKNQLKCGLCYAFVK